MIELKVGDRVRVKENLVRGGVTGNAKKGEEGVVKEVGTVGYLYYVLMDRNINATCRNYSGGTNSYIGYFTSDEIELLPEEFKVGDGVELKSYYAFAKPTTFKLVDYAEIGDVGKITRVDSARSISVSFNGNTSFGFHYEEIDRCLIKKPTHSVPLRVRDKVRVVGSDSPHPIGYTDTIQRFNSMASDYCYLKNESGREDGMHTANSSLTLIPTEADITVGSVWEVVHSKELKEIVGFNEYGFLFKGFDVPWSGDHKRNFLDKHKLIHRGDEGVVSNIEISSEVWSEQKCKKHFDEANGKQTNKKEKKMKRAEKVIALKNRVEDTDCNNQGVVVAIYPKREQVSYEESDGTVRTVHVSKLIQRFVFPKPKPVKKKGGK